MIWNREQLSTNNMKPPKLKVIGSFHSSRPFSIKPYFDDYGSAIFRVDMRIPSLIWFGFALAIPIAFLIDFLFNPKVYSNPSKIILIVSIFSASMFVIGMYTLRLWRSIRIDKNGDVNLDIPRPIGRKRINLSSGNVWIDEVQRIRNGKKGIHLSVSANIFERRNSPHRTSALVVHNKKISFLLVHDQPEKIAQTLELLMNDYNMSSSGTEYTINFSGLMDEGWA